VLREVAEIAISRNQGDLVIDAGLRDEGVRQARTKTLCQKGRSGLCGT
jgi:hypothetical protein